MESAAGKCNSKMLEAFIRMLNTTEANESEDEYDDIPLSLLRQKILQEKWKEVHDIQGLLQVVLPEVILFTL